MLEASAHSAMLRPAGGRVVSSILRLPQISNRFLLDPSSLGTNMETSPEVGVGDGVEGAVSAGFRVMSWQGSDLTYCLKDPVSEHLGFLSGETAIPALLFAHDNPERDFVCFLDAGL